MNLLDIRCKFFKLEKEKSTPSNFFSEVYLDLDPEELERECLYFEEIMDIIELKRLNGPLAKFNYGFDINNLLNKD